MREQAQGPCRASLHGALPPRQEETLDALIGYWTAHDRFPTYAELSVVLGGVDRGHAYSLVQALVGKGFVSKAAGELSWEPATVARVEDLIAGGVVHEDDLPVYAMFLDRVGS